jgi:hypothetical protein
MKVKGRERSANSNKGVFGYFGWYHGIIKEFKVVD